MRHASAELPAELGYLAVSLRFRPALRFRTKCCLNVVPSSANRP